KCDILLKLYNKKTKSLSLKNVLGDIRVRAGCLIPVFLDLGDIELQNYMLVEKVKHTFENNSHFMDLTLVDGDEFASYSSSSYSSGNSNNKNEKQNGPAQSTTKKNTGRKVPALFTAYYPGPGIEGGDKDCTGKKLVPKNQTCAAPMDVKKYYKSWYSEKFLKDHPFIKLNDKIKVILPGSSIDGKTYTVRDNGSAINISSSGVYDIDILMSTASECNRFGKRKGYIIINGEEEQTYQVQGNNQNSNTNNNSKADKLINIAKSKLGCKYVYGAEGPNTFDCSGFTQWCYKQIGIKIPRTASAQSKAGKAVDLKDRSKWKAGDLLCRVGGGSSNHVMMYIGNGQMIHSPQTGDVVKIQSVDSYRKGKAYTHVRRFI
ncbi:TPA: C40 family peptidase, partial [Clostridioides difficile]|nr:C40 family peptidase [Clostridioides difficile]